LNEVPAKIPHRTPFSQGLVGEDEADQPKGVSLGESPSGWIPFREYRKSGESIGTLNKSEIVYEKRL
jgi:hypothetical protein